MAMYSFWLIVIFILLFNLPMYKNENAKKGSTSGPYRATLTDFGDCKNPTRPFIVDNPVILQLQQSNSSGHSLLSGNVTIIKDVKLPKYKMKCFLWENGKWKLVYIMNEIGCNSLTLQLVVAAANINYDKGKCSFKRGSYSFKNMDINAMVHHWMKKMDYGKLMWRTEFYHPKLGTYFCTEYQVDLSPI